MSYHYLQENIKDIIDTIRYKEVDLQYARSSGPGWQNVNKRETKVQLSRDIKNSTTIPEPYKQRCIAAHQNLINEDWILRLNTQVHRTQEWNKELLHKKLASIIKDCFKEVKIRKATSIPKHVIEARWMEKKRRSKIRGNRKVSQYTD